MAVFKETTKIKPSFIELTYIENEDEAKMYVNVQYIAGISKNDKINKTILLFSNGHMAYVRETPEEIINEIK